MKIIATHLLNDYSGSPKVLMQLLKGWVKNGFTVELHTCDGRDGFLSNLPGVSYSFFKYQWAANPILRLANLVASQVSLCLAILKTAKKQDVVYINTVLPFGAAFAGKIKGCRVIYHIHETSVKPAILKSFLFGMVKWCATDVIYVSDYLSNQERIKGVNLHVLHNAIEDTFLATANTSKKERAGLDNILMVCSLKDYKGIHEYIALAHKLPGHSFKLVLNASHEEIDEYFCNVHVPANVNIYETQKNVHPFYEWTDLVLNLSQPDSWIETFGLTIIEGMAYGNPAIVPPVGGITEVVTANQNGFHISSVNTDEIAVKIRNWSMDDSYFKTFQNAAKQAVKRFNEQTFITKNIQILTTT